MGLKASIVIPNLDSPLVDRTLAAIRAQELKPGSVEVLVVGQDAPGKVPRDGSVHFLETTDRLSPAAARNLGVSKARADRVLFTDADCRPAPDWAAHLLRRLEHYPVAGGSVLFSLSGNHWAVADNIASFNELLSDRPAMVSTDRPLGSLNLALRREAWDRVGAFDEDLVTSEDFDWILRARDCGLQVFFEPRAQVEHADTRHDRRALEEHASWYGSHFNAFRRKHPGVFDRGPTWKSRRRLALTRPLKAWVSALEIYRDHPMLRAAWRTYPAVVIFKMSWYRAVLDTWQDP